MNKNKGVCFSDVIRLIIIKTRLKMKNKSQLYDINRPRPRHGPKYTKYKMFVSIIVTYIKQYLNNI